MESCDFSLESGQFAFERVHVFGQEVDLGVAFRNGLFQLGDVSLGQGVLTGLILVSVMRIRGRGREEKKRVRRMKITFYNIINILLK